MNGKSWTNVALGLWLALSAFVLPRRAGAGITENVVTGLFVALFALWSARAYKPYVSLVASWAVMLSGLWIAAAPFVLGYAHPAIRLANDVIVGLVVFVLAATNTRVKARRAGV